jgi:hypothetical protein
VAKAPAFQFYPGDWLNDAALRMVSVGARGCWIDMLCLMHQGSPYGFLKVNGAVILPANLARMVGGTLREVSAWLAELEAAGVFSRDEEGCIYSRRMVRDHDIRTKRAEGGCKGGNPALINPYKDNGKVESKVNLPPNLQPTPSSSSSSSSSNTPPPPSLPPMREEQEEDSATPSDRGDSLPIESEWSEIGRLLRSLGVGDPARSIAGARNGGAGPSDVLAVIAHYQASPGAWTPSLLSGRVARCAEGLASNAYWPPKAGVAARAAPKQTDAERQQREDFDAMRIVKDDRRLKKTDQQIEADLRRAGLGESVDRLDWRTKEKVATS